MPDPNRRAKGHYALVPTRLLASVQVLEEQLPKLAARIEAAELKLKLSGAREVIDAYDRLLHAVEAVRTALAESERQLRADIDELRSAQDARIDAAHGRLAEASRAAEDRLAALEHRLSGVGAKVDSLGSGLELVEDVLHEVAPPAAAASASTPAGRGRWLLYPATAAAIGVAVGLWQL